MAGNDGQDGVHSLGLSSSRAAEMVLPINRLALAHSLGDRLDDQTINDLVVFATSGIATMTYTWVVAGEDPLDPEESAD